MGESATWAVAIVTGILSLVGAFSGAWFAVWYKDQLDQQRQERKRQEHVSAVSKQLHDEIDGNLALIQAFRDKIEHSREGTGEEQSFICRALFVNEQMSFWMTVVYKSQASQFADVPPSSIASGVHALYDRLETLQRFQERMKGRVRPTLVEDYFEWKPRSRVAGETQFEGMSFFRDCADFNAKTSEDWCRAWQVISQLLGTGNPAPLPTASVPAESGMMKLLPLRRQYTASEA